MDKLLKKITTFLDRQRLEPSAFGLLAANDPHLVFDIRRGRQLRRKLAGKVEDFMKTYKVREK